MPEGQVSIPGSGGRIPPGTITDVPGFGSGNDFDHALREVVANATAIPAGVLFRVNFQRCADSPPPQAGDFTCTVISTSDPLGLPVPGTTCAARIPAASAPQGSSWCAPQSSWSLRSSRTRCRQPAPSSAGRAGVRSRCGSSANRARRSSTPPRSVWSVRPGRRVSFQSCQGASAPTVADFTCTVLSAADPDGLNVTGATCAVTIP